MVSMITKNKEYCVSVKQTLWKMIYLITMVTVWLSRTRNLYRYVFSPLLLEQYLDFFKLCRFTIETDQHTRPEKRDDSLLILPQQNESFRGYTRISLSVLLCVRPSIRVCLSLYKILLFVKTLTWVSSHIQ